MRRNSKREIKKTIIYICLLLTLSLSIGYAVLTEQLKLNGTVNYGAMAWDVGFTTVEDGGGTITSSPSISQDKKSITISCDVGTSTSSETCIAKAKIKNDSSFDIELSQNPDITFDNTYIESVTAIWTEDNTAITAFDTINGATTKEIQVTITTKELTNDLLPETALNVPVDITLDWVEAGATSDDNIITLNSIDDRAYESLTYRDIFLTKNKVTNINFINKDNLSSLGSWTQNGTGATPTVDTTNYVTGPSSMRIDATESSQYKNDIIDRNHTYYYAAKVSVERYVAGYLGIGMGNQTKYDKMGATVNYVTDGFVTVSYHYKVSDSTQPSFFIGSMASANITGNIDSIVVIDLADLDVETAPTKAQLDVLYEEFIKLYNGETIRKTKEESLAFPDGVIGYNTARTTFYNALKTKTQSINMKYSSSFSNASGLSSGSGKVTIQDLVQLGVIASSNEELTTVWGEPSYVLEDKASGKTQTLTSTVTAGTYSSALSNTYTILGGKTGSTSVYNLLVVVEDKNTGIKYVGAVSSDTADSATSNRFSNAKILFDIAARLVVDRDADISDLESQLKSNRASVVMLPEDTNHFLTNDIFESEYHLYTKGASDIFMYASTQKVLSIITAMDYIDDLDEVVTMVSSDIQSGSGPTITAGEQYTIRDLLYGMMLPSSNTFAEALARVAGTKMYYSNNQ